MSADEHELRRRAGIHDALSSAIDDGGHGLEFVPKLLHQVLEQHTWDEFITSRGEHVHHADFLSFVAAQPLKGLGAKVETVRRIIRDDVALVDLLDRHVQRQQLRARRNNVQGESPVPAPAGNSQERALRRLRKDAPDYHARVVAGEMSPHRAMVEAGFRPRAVSINPAQPASVARILHREMNVEQRAELIRLLTAPNWPPPAD